MCVQSTATQNDLRNSMMLNGSKHQHDLFSGSLGIPDVNTHVGRVVHDFEMMSRSRGASPTGQESQRSQRNSEVILSPIEHPYELHTISNAVDRTATNDDGKNKSSGSGAVDKRQQAYRKSDGSMNANVQNPSQQIIKDRIHRFIDIPTPPPPPSMLAANLPPLSQEIDDELANNPIRNMQNKFYFEKMSVKYNAKHTVPRAQPVENSTVDGNEMTQQFIPASQIIRMNESVQKSRPSGSSVGKRNVTMARGNTFDDNASIAAAQQHGNEPKDSYNPNEYRRKLFGSQPNIIDYKVFNASTAIPANLNSTLFQTNYANIDFRENFDQPPLPRSKRFSQPHTFRRVPKNDTNNNYNAEQIYERPPADIFSHATDSLGNRFLNRTNQINNNSANNNRTSNFTDANNDNWFYQSNVDDQMLLRGTTVSQSFIKTMKSAERQKAFKQQQRSQSTHYSSSTSNGFKRVEPMKSSNKRSTRSYYRPQKYILNDDDDDDYDDELRARYTEHGSSATLASTKPLSRNFKLSKNSNRFGYRQAKRV